MGQPAPEEEERLARRRKSTDDLRFPFDAYRLGQERFEQAALEVLEAGRCLLAAAPPGLGKTAAALTVFESAFNEVNSAYPFDYEFVDASFENQYKSEVVIVVQ